MPVLEINAISKSYGKIRALENVSFNIPKGSVFGLLGPNGSGKTTLLSIVLDVLQANSGGYKWFGESPTYLHRKKIGSLLETPNLYHYLTAVQNLRITQTISGRGNEGDIHAVLEKVNLHERKNSRFSTYSLGMKQRLAIAAALLGDPAVLVLDEPTNGLDPQGIADIRQLIKSLSKDQGKTVLVSSHLLSEIEQIASHILIIHQGKKMAEGPTSSLLDPNKTIVQIKTLDDLGAKQKLMGSPYRAHLLERNEGLYLRIPKLEIPGLNAFLVASHIDLVSLEAKNSLEDYFLQLTSTY